MHRILPEPVSTFASDVDWIHNVITYISVFFIIGITAVAVYFAIRYRQKGDKPHKTPHIHGDNRLEILWTLIPTLVVIFVATQGYLIHKEMRTPPPDAFEVNVTAQQFAWTFTYPNGKVSNGELVLPVDKPVKLIMKSRDVIHSFFVPAMRTKQDVLPTQYTYLWFEPTKTGEYQAFCAEYCGTNHSGMLAKVKVVSQGEYDRWLNDRSDEIAKSKMSPVELGRKLYKDKLCYTCHSIDGSRLVGPSFAGIWGKKEKLSDGSEVVVDENYIEESLRNPNAKVVAGYPPAMPSYEGQLSDEEISALIAFIKDLKEGAGGGKEKQAAKTEAKTSEAGADAGSPLKRGEELFKTKLCATCHSIDGTRLVGPSMKGLYGKTEELADGSKVVVDDEYIKESILNPSAKIVKSYPPAMPSFKGQLSEEDIKSLIEYIKSLK